MNQQPSYLTKEGAEKLRAELDYLQGTVRTDLAKRLRAAIQMGDLSENADYTAAKEEQAFVEGRIMELTAILKNVIIIDDKKGKANIVEIGSTVTIQEGREPEEIFRLVGPHEANPRNGMISYDSPIGQALMGHRVGEMIVANAPGGEIRFTILDIR